MFSVVLLVVTCARTHTHNYHTTRNAIRNIANSADWSTDDGDIDALITVEVLIVAPDRETGEQLHIANIQFNNLDIIGECFFGHILKILLTKYPIFI